MYFFIIKVYDDWVNDIHQVKLQQGQSTSTENTLMVCIIYIFFQKILTSNNIIFHFTKNYSNLYLVDKNSCYMKTLLLFFQKMKGI